MVPSLSFVVKGFQKPSPMIPPRFVLASALMSAETVEPVDISTY